MNRKLRGQRTVVAAATIALAFLALGCGKQTEQAATETTTTSGAGIARMDQVVAASTGTITREAGTPGVGDATTSADSLPPDVAAFAPDTVLAPGSVVEILAEGSIDVTGIMLADGAGQSKPFVYDSTAKIWRAYYRVPVRSTAERLGLSVTATTGTGRWKRVWVFLELKGGEKPSVTEPDSGR